MPQTSLFTVSVLCMLSAGNLALAQDGGGSDYRSIDLDGSNPAERVYTIPRLGFSAPSFSVVIWNAERGQWIDVFRGSGDGAQLSFGTTESGTLASITADGREWVWDSNRYVPLANTSLIEYGTINIELIPEVQRVGGAPVPTDTYVVRYSEPDGTVSEIAVLDSDSSFCGMGGGLCPAVLIRDGMVIENIGVDIGHSFGVSELLGEDGYRLIEQGRFDGVVLRDALNGEVVGLIREQKSAIAVLQPSAPNSQE